MQLELINTGTELLLGHTINTHVAYLGETLLPLGLRISRQLAIPDGAVIRDALAETFGRAEIVLVTGGLGPTSDDITREIAAELLGMELEESVEVREAIQTRLARRNREMNANTLRQAMVPKGAEVLRNEHGTAPGLYFPPQALPQADGEPIRHTPHLFLLPGPPRELKPMVEEIVKPQLRKIIAGRIVQQNLRNFRLCNVGESEVERTVEPALRSLGEDVEIGYCAKLGEIVVRVIGTPEQLEAARMIVAQAFPNQYFSDNDATLNQTVVGLLRKMGRTVATAESCTGGGIGSLITDVPGSSEIFIQGIITYANEAKTRLAGVSPTLLAEHGAVSEAVCAAMAQGCLERSGTTYALSATGIAGPGGGSEAKPVGTVYVGLAGPDGLLVVEKHFLNMARTTFKSMVAVLALDLLRRHLQ